MIQKDSLIDKRYKIIKLIGEGGMSNVYLSEDTILNRKVAIKILHTSLAKNEKFVERFKREAKAVTSFVHPNIVEVYDMGVSNGLYFIVMEYLEGETLKEFLKNNRGKISINRVISIAIDICEGLKIAHEKNIYHRDLKPQNVFIKKDYSIKIVDFGIAYHQQASPLTQTNAVMGSVHYLSPEQAKGESATIQTDIYSLGIVMYEMLTGELPYRGDTAVNIVLKHLREPFPFVKDKRCDVPQSLENIILKCTAKNKNDRYKNLDEIIYDLNHVFDKDRINQPRLYFDDTSITQDNKYYNLEDNDDNLEITKENISNKVKSKKNIYHSKKFKLLLLGFILITLSILSYVIYDRSVHTYIPEVRNNTIEEGKYKLFRNNLQLGFIEHESSDDIQEGRIISTDIPYNTKVNKNSFVNFKVSKGKVIHVPELTQKTEEEAKKICENLKIKYKVEYFSPTDLDIKDGIVMKQSKVSGEDLNVINDVIILTVSKKNEYEIPDFTGRNKTDVLEYIKDRRININIEYDYSDTILEGFVIKMVDFYSHKKIREGETFSILVSKGKNPLAIPPAPVPVPTPNPNPSPTPNPIPNPTPNPVVPNTENHTQLIPSLFL